MTSKRILEIRHIECEPPGAYTPVLHEYGTVETVRAWREPLPLNPADVDAIILMGGPMGANDGAIVPWVDAEIAFLQTALADQVPIWGVCLGAQLLAAALGAKVSTGDRPEVGVLDLILTDDGRADPIWGADVPPVFPALQWHSDTFEIPPGAVWLARSAAYDHQLFRYEKSYGVQFHLEATLDLIDDWLAVDEYRSSLDASIGAEAAGDFLDQIRAAQSSTIDMATSVMRRWLDSL